MADHFVEIFIDQDGATPHFTCTASADDDVTTSPCRYWCSTCDEVCLCDGFDAYADHLSYCRLIEAWFDDDPWALYDGERTLARSGPVEFAWDAWDGDTYMWHYTDTPAPTAKETQ